MDPKRCRLDRMLHRTLGSIGFFVTAAALFTLGLVTAGSRSPIAYIGAAGLLLAWVLPRLEGPFEVSPFGLKAQLALNPVLRDVVEVAVRANVDALTSVVPQLAGDVGTARLVVPPRWVGKTLESELRFIRQVYDIAVFAIYVPASDTWIAGGPVTKEPLPEGGELLLAGEGAKVSAFAALVTLDRLPEHPERQDS